MKLEHFEAYAPLCPRCLVSRQSEEPLRLALIASRDGEDILEGTLHCPSGQCGQEFPILDGIPFLVPDPREYVKANFNEITRRDDFTPELRSLLGDCSPEDNLYESSRQHQSTWGWGHYADLDPGEPSKEPKVTVLAILRAALERVGPWGPGLALDAGCSVGRTTFELASRSEDLVLGIDLNVSLLRMASTVLRQGVVRYPRRRQGLVYDWREFAADLPGRDRVDFWLCDAMALPFPGQRLALANSLNLLDAVRSPHAHLANLGRVLAPGPPPNVGTPYDWNPTVTPLEGWLGGHSQRRTHGGRSELVLHTILSPGEHETSTVGLRWEDEIPSTEWVVRLHERSTVRYRPHVVIARAT